MAEVIAATETPQVVQDTRDVNSYVLSPGSIDAVQSEDVRQELPSSSSGEAAQAGTAASASNTNPDAVASHAAARATNALLQTRKDTFAFEQSSQDAFYEAIDPSLKRGTTMLKVSAKKVQRRLVRIKPEAGQLLWESKHAGIRGPPFSLAFLYLHDDRLTGRMLYLFHS